jgi:hypothetical protein
MSLGWIEQNRRRPPGPLAPEQAKAFVCFSLYDGGIRRLWEFVGNGLIGTVGWELPTVYFSIDKPREFSPPVGVFVAEFCICHNRGDGQE